MNDVAILMQTSVSKSDCIVKSDKINVTVCNCLLPITVT